MRSNTKICGICQTSFADSDCIHFPGQGSTDEPATPYPIVAPSATNLFECSPSGLAGYLPPIYQDPPACHIYATIDQTIAYDAAQILFFDEERYDTDNMHDKEGATSRIVINTSGLYLVTLNVQWTKTGDNTAEGHQAAYIRKNGSAFVALDSFPVGGGDIYTMQSLSEQVPLTSGEYLEALVKQKIRIDDEPRSLRIIADRSSPILSAIFIRPIKAMNIMGVAESYSADPAEEYLLDGDHWWVTPDNSSLDITGDIDIRAVAALDDWTPGSAQAVIGKYVTAGSQRSYGLQVLPAGTLDFFWSDNGSSARSSVSTAAPVVSDGAVLAIRATRATGGTVTFYTKATTRETALADAESNSGWSALGAAVAGTAGSMFSGSADLLGGAWDAGASGRIVGEIDALVVKNGINGTTVANPDFYSNSSPFVDSSGNAWTRV